MKESHPAVGLHTLCRLFGKTRQAWYELNKYNELELMESNIVISEVKRIKVKMPRIGGRKLLFLLQNTLHSHQIKMGRDKLFELLGTNGLLVTRKRRRPYTTDSYHHFKKYPNLIKDLSITFPETLWVSDITYIRVKENFSYLSLITDAYSKKIIGYNLSRFLDTKGCLISLRMALTNRKHVTRALIHHSDRGLQYCCRAYIDLLKDSGIKISMTEKGDPYENAIAERVNGILKSEFFLEKHFNSHAEAVVAVEQAIQTYNNERPHSSCDYLTPESAHHKSGTLKKRWKNYPYNSKVAMEDN